MRCKSLLKMLYWFLSEAGFMNIILISDRDLLEDDTYVFYKYDERYLHIKKILKLSVGGKFKAGIINGKIGSALIIFFGSERLVFSFSETAIPFCLPPINLILGFPRPIQLRRILRDAASLGFLHLFLSGTELGEKSYLNSNLASYEEVQKYLLEGISQAGQNLLPAFSFFNSIKECVNSNFFCMKQKKILLDISENAEPLAGLKLNRDETVTAAIGSERGWSDCERKIFYEAGFKPYSLGKRILRTETAVCAALSIIIANNF